ncbi:MAG: hypothetical protein NTU49_01815 [Gammaproteobacteria bacterium]|nr:hypothetical protein [Gammaproteobacteria bacterium]
MKPDGQYLESLDLFSKFPYRQAVIPWARLSEKFAKEASGNISAFVEGASSTSIFTTVEKPILISNPSITITYSPEFDSSYILKP